jgi:hypothetical protein
VQHLAIGALAGAGDRRTREAAARSDGAAAVQQVLPGMWKLGRGTILFIN